MKICVFTSWFPESNNPLYGIFVVDQVKALQDQNINIAVCYLEKEKFSTLKNKAPRKEIIQSIKTYRSFIKKIPIRSKLALSYYKKRYAKAYKAYKKENGKPDLIHAHNYLCAAAALAIAQLENVPIIITEHAAAVQQLALPSYHLNICKKVYNISNLVIAVSKQLQQSILEISPKANIVVIPNLLKDQFNYQEKNKISSDIQLLAIGSLLKNKRFDLLIESVSILNNSLNNYTVHLKIIGNGKEYAKLNDRIDSLELQNQITICKEKSNDLLYEEYLNAHILISTSITETFGMVAMEALACGTPVVTTQNGGTSDFVNDRNGIVIKEANPEVLSTAIKKVIANYEAYNLKAISQEIHSTYNAKKIANALIDQYKKFSRL